MALNADATTGIDAALPNNVTDSAILQDVPPTQPPTPLGTIEPGTTENSSIEPGSSAPGSIELGNIGQPAVLGGTKVRKDRSHLFMDAIQKPGLVNWSSEEKVDINTAIAKARLKDRRRQLNLQRGGKARMEAKKRAAADTKAPIAPVTAANHEVTEAPKITTTAAAAAVKTKPAVDPVREKIKKGQQARKARQQALEDQRVFEVSGTGTDFDKVQLNLDE